MTTTFGELKGAFEEAVKEAAVSLRVLEILEGVEPKQRNDTDTTTSYNTELLLKQLEALRSNGNRDAFLNNVTMRIKAIQEKI